MRKYAENFSVTLYNTILYEEKNRFSEEKTVIFFTSEEKPLFSSLVYDQPAML